MGCIPMIIPLHTQSDSQHFKAFCNAVKKMKFRTHCQLKKIELCYKSHNNCKAVPYR